MLTHCFYIVFPAHFLARHTQPLDFTKLSEEHVQQLLTDRVRGVRALRNENRHVRRRVTCSRCWHIHAVAGACAAFMFRLSNNWEREPALWQNVSVKTMQREILTELKLDVLDPARQKELRTTITEIASLQLVCMLHAAARWWFFGFSTSRAVVGFRQLRAFDICFVFAGGKEGGGGGGRRQVSQSRAMHKCRMDLRTCSGCVFPCR